jgi:hypothetical protein
MGDTEKCCKTAVKIKYSILSLVLDFSDTCRMLPDLFKAKSELVLTLQVNES